MEFHSKLATRSSKPHQKSKALDNQNHPTRQAVTAKETKEKKKKTNAWLVQVYRPLFPKIQVLCTHKQTLEELYPDNVPTRLQPN